MLRAHKVSRHKGARFSVRTCTARFQAAMVFFAVVVVGGSIAQGDDGFDSALATIANPHDIRELKAAYTRILKGASPHKLRVLTKERSDGLALASAWREAVNSCESGTPSQTRVMCAYTRFVGFVDGRLPVEVPEWWEHNVASAVWYKRGESVSIRCDPTPMVKASAIAGTVYVPKGWSVREVAAGLELAIRDSRVIVPSDLWGRLKTVPFAPLLIPVVDGESAFVVIAQDYPYRAAILAKASCRTGKLLWERKIWTGGELTSIAISGPVETTHVVEPKIGRDGSVYVFGTSIFGAYIESFTTTDGTPRLRFSTLCLQEW